MEMATENSVRMSIDVPPDLHQLIKRVASREHQTIKDFVVEAVREQLRLKVDGHRQEMKRQLREFNKLTRKTLEKTDRGEDLHEYESVDAFFAEMAEKKG